LDELPQLFNVLAGQMSLVGPRPCLPYERRLYAPWHQLRFDALPGLTGLWQVSGKNMLPFAQMMRLDVRYGRTASLRGDAAILLKTPLVLLGQARACLGKSPIRIGGRNPGRRAVRGQWAPPERSPSSRRDAPAVRHGAEASAADDATIGELKRPRSGTIWFRGDQHGIPCMEERPGRDEDVAADDTTS
jgi:hypothetical protein